jgi:hypothetical protein
MQEVPRWIDLSPPITPNCKDIFDDNNHNNKLTSAIIKMKTEKVINAANTSLVTFGLVMKFIFQAIIPMSPSAKHIVITLVVTRKIRHLDFL